MKNIDTIKKGIKRFFVSLTELHTTLCKMPNPKLIMTLLVKNEEDIIEQNILFHHQMGVDAFIVTDNNSTDKTMEILLKYKEKGWIVEIIEEKSTGYEQKRWVDNMIMLAKKKYKAEWVINADADEFWYTSLGSLKREMTDIRGNVLTTRMKVVYPIEGEGWGQWDETVRPISKKKIMELGLSPYCVFRKNRSKVAHRTSGYLHISMGNHKVAMFPRKKEESNITIYHYMWRGHEHFIQKIINGGKELEKHSSQHGGAHWRYFYDIYKKGQIEEEYRKVFAISYVEELRNNGYLVKDNPVPFYLKIN